MTIQFNLLPDIKIQYLKTKRQQRVVILLSMFTTIISVSLLAILLTVVFGVQKKTIGDLNRDIGSKSKKLESTTDLDKILTVQSQLVSLTGLHDSKVVASRIYTYLPQITPVNVSVSKFSADFTSSTLSVAGNANNITAVNTYVDTLKFAKYTADGKSAELPVFSNVVLSGFSVTTASSSYSISMNFDPVIFSEKHTIALTIPNTVTTRSVTDQPSLFKLNSGGN